MFLSSRWFHLPLAAVLFGGLVSSAADHVRSLQAAAWESGTADWGHWGSQPGKYSGSTKHSNRLIPVYTFGAELDEFLGEKSIYRDADGLTRLYGRVPEATLNAAATWFDQTDLYRLQQAAVAAGKKCVCGRDWPIAL